MSSLFRIYERLLKKHPLITSSLQTGVLMGTGDLISQTLVEKKPLDKVNFVRTTQFVGLGLFLAGPTLTSWYRVLSSKFGDSGKTVVLKKLACDQLLFAPVFIGIFLSTLGIMQGKGIDRTVYELKKDYSDILLNNYKLWPVVQLGNFYFVPLRYQILSVQTVALFWNTYLSWKTQAGNKAAEYDCQEKKLI